MNLIHTLIVNLLNHFISLSRRYYLRRKPQTLFYVNPSAPKPRNDQNIAANTSHLSINHHRQRHLAPWRPTPVPTSPVADSDSVPAF